MCLEVEVSGKDTGTYQLFLQDIHEVQQVFWLAATDVIDGIGRDRQAILTLLALWSALHHTIHALYDVIDVSEVTTAVAVVEYLDGLPLQQPLTLASQLCKEVLEPLRSFVGAPIIISSSYRCNQLNVKVGGAYASQHALGEAADVQLPLTSYTA